MQYFEFKVFPQNNFMDLSLLQFGRSGCKSGYSFGPAARNHYLFHFILSGKGTLYADNSSGTTETYKINANEGFMLFPDQVSTYIADNDDPWEYIWIEFDGFKAKAAVEETGLTLDNPVYFPASVELRDLVLKEMNYIINNKDENPLNLIAHLYLFLDCFTRSAVTSQPQSKKKRASVTTISTKLSDILNLIIKGILPLRTLLKTADLTETISEKSLRRNTEKHRRNFLCASE